MSFRISMVLCLTLLAMHPTEVFAKKKRDEKDKSPKKEKKAEKIKSDAQILSQNLKLLVAPKDQKTVKATMKALKKDKNSGVSEACKASASCLRAQAIAYEVANGNTSIAHTIAVRECADARNRTDGIKKSKALKGCIQKVGAMKKAKMHEEIEQLARAPGGLLERTLFLGMPRQQERIAEVLVDQPALALQTETALESTVQVQPDPAEQSAPPQGDTEASLGAFGGF